ncbi:hypothetical protein CQW23_00523 [Capsicum baccatum]|uniref:Uncharacterized protein n=1 Tax=Capsicum baccatum TaxID=33114 RepID=A0A2G2XL00_CAPBA|nr:hypothetical protein CQW23_00523 [Capsicum baccatum]
MVMMKEPTPRRDKENYNNINKNSYSSMRCPHCAGPLSKEMETSEWTVPPLIRDSFSMAPPVIVFSSACAGLAGGAVPAFAQLASSSYHAAISSSTLPPTASQDENMRKSTSSTL